MTLDIITSPALAPCPHGFFGRSGGASSGIFQGLNCGFGSSDQHEAVAINRDRVAQTLDTSSSHLLGVHQVHSAEVITVTEPPYDRPKADGIVTATPGLALSILTADCMPVLMADARAGVIGAAHAGWKGAVGGILQNTIAGMEALGADRSRIHATIGPCISQRAYEVGPEFFDTFMSEDPDNAAYFAQGEGDRMLFDLPGYGLRQLREAGVTADWTRHCTYSDPDRFFSYRRATHNKEADYGRLIAAIRL